ncbi:MAG TPA: ribonuclease R [Bacilli bacterium]
MMTEQELLDFMQETAYKPMTYQELEKQFKLASATEFKAFLKLLTGLEQSGKILRTRTDRYGVPERMNLLRGKLQAHAKGFGFLIPEDRAQTDVYINANDMLGAMNGDTVLVRTTTKSAAGGRVEGEVVRVVTRANTKVVGVFQNNGSFAFVIADDKRIVKDIFIPQHAFMGAQDGQKVVAQIVQYPQGTDAAEAEVIEILGFKDDPGVDILSIIRKHNLPEAFPDEVLQEAEAIPAKISEEDLKNRRDLRDLRIVTIDGEDAKDLDDAVHVQRLPNGNLKLGVHIADVGYYVEEGSPLDQDAYARGCSVYLVDRVIPMLPQRLSNGICSLNPQVDRLTMSCDMEFDADGKVVNHEVYTSVIRTTERMTYTNVRKILQKEEPELLERYKDLIEDFYLMEELAMRLRRARMKRGAIDFDFTESKVIVDEQGKPVDIIARERSIAEMIIEEFMLAANETVAEHFHWLKVPFLYRIHEDPDAEKLLHFMEFITNFGYVLRGKGNNSVHPGALQALLEEIKETKEAAVIGKVLLRSMKQAKYDSQSLGHFGLSAEFYSHFTSPIRRYPDLVIHRVMREVLESGKLSDKRHDYLSSRMDDIAKQSSERERVAVEAERDTDALKKAEFMLDKVGEEFEGIISSVTNFGMFIELANTVEGLIRLSDLTDDYYHYHELKHCLIGERTSKIFSIGDEVKVRVARVNIQDHTIDFEMVDMKPRMKSMSFVGGRGTAGNGTSAGRRGKNGGVSGEYTGVKRGAKGGSGKKRLNPAAQAFGKANRAKSGKNGNGSKNGAADKNGAVSAGSVMGTGTGENGTATAGAPAAESSGFKRAKSFIGGGSSSGSSNGGSKKNGHKDKPWHKSKSAGKDKGPSGQANASKPLWPDSPSSVAVAEKKRKKNTKKD